jgi:superfamily II DNA or RNA helicase
MLTLEGYKIAKKDISNLNHMKSMLNVRPYVPSVFVKPQYVKKYPVYKEDSEFLYVPKHFGIQHFGPLKTSLRNITKQNESNWEFNGSIRTNQEEVIKSFLCPEPRDGIISLQTGGGKTVCALFIASKLRVPTIILVHNTFLRDQWTDRIKSFLPKARIRIWNDDNTIDTMIQDFVIRVDGDIVKYKSGIQSPNFKLLKNMKKEEIEIISKIIGDIPTLENIKKYASQQDITIAMIQGVMRDSVSSENFKEIGFVIVDECHHIASESFSKCVPKLTSQYMLGLSATPERKDKLMHVINWFLGPILYKSDTSDKKDENVKVEVYEFEPDNEEFNTIIYNSQGVMFTSLMVNKLVEFQERNKFLVEILLDVIEDKRQLLVLSDRVDHLKTLFELFPPEIQEQACILGREVKSEQRTIWCSTKKVLLATYQMCKEGFDVATLNTLVIATPRPDVDQIVGRILRTEKVGREINPLIIDIVDSTFRRQFQSRLSLYNSRNYKVEKMKLI